MKKYTIAVLEGDGIGPEVTRESIKVLKTISELLDIQFNFQYGLVGGVAIDKTSTPYPNETHQLCLNSDSILFGAIGNPKFDNDPKVKIRPEQGLLKMRNDLGLFANIRPVQTWKSLYSSSPLKNHLLENVDIIFVRELTSGIYFGEPRGRSENNSKAFDTCTYTITEIERVSKIAFDLAFKRKKKLTLVDKANVLATSRLWRETVQNMSVNYPDVNVDYQFVDNAAMQLIRKPSQFDVILTSNLFGDILSDEASMLPGSLGLLPSSSIGQNIGMFEPIHGSYPQVAGKNIANPIASILSSALMLEFLNENKAADLIKTAVENALDNKMTTTDLNGKLSTTEVGDFICHSLKENQ